MAAEETKTGNARAEAAVAQAVADKMEIQELATRYENTFDAGDFDAHMEVWAGEFTFESSFGNHDTPGAYREWLEGFYEQTQRDYGGTRHLVTNFDIRLDGDSASMTCYLTIFAQDGKTLADAPGRAVVAGTVVFPEDRLERVNGEWKFVHRTLLLDQSVPESGSEQEGTQ